MITAILLLVVGLSVHAQEISKNALGVRLGDNDGFGGEISYQTRLSTATRLELDLGWRDSNKLEAYKLVGLYQWVMPLEDHFNWYVGLGGGVGSFKNRNKDNEYEGSFALVAANIGIEYNLNVPLQFSLDFRPELGFNDRYRDDIGLDIALGIRYRF
jgi:outer membrane translocation and assembly module TamA